MVFHSKAFKQLYSHKNTVYFKTVKRQSDPKFIRLLQETRVANLSPESWALLESRVGVPIPSNLLIQPTVLFPRRKQSQDYNLDELAKIDQPCHVFNARYIASPMVNKIQNEKNKALLLKHAPMYERLSLKVGAQVMLTANKPMWVPKKWNGSLGKIIQFEERTNHPIVEFADKSVQVIPQNTWKGTNGRGQLIQYPLIHGWAISIHKSQGFTLEYGRLTLNYQASQYGQAYTALSRFRELNKIFIQPDFDRRCIRANPEALEYFKQLDALPPLPPLKPSKKRKLKLNPGKKRKLKLNPGKKKTKIPQKKTSPPSSGKPPSGKRKSSPQSNQQNQPKLKQTKIQSMLKRKISFDELVQVKKTK
jgi:hypothetical protein